MSLDIRDFRSFTSERLSASPVYYSTPASPSNAKRDICLEPFNAPPNLGYNLQGRMRYYYVPDENALGGRFDSFSGGEYFESRQGGLSGPQYYNTYDLQGKIASTEESHRGINFLAVNTSTPLSDEFMGGNDIDFSLDYTNYVADPASVGSGEWSFSAGPVLNSIHSYNHRETSRVLNPTYVSPTSLTFSVSPTELAGDLVKTSVYDSLSANDGVTDQIINLFPQDHSALFEEISVPSGSLSVASGFQRRADGRVSGKSSINGWVWGQLFSGYLFNPTDSEYGYDCVSGARINETGSVTADVGLRFLPDEIWDVEHVNSPYGNENYDDAAGIAPGDVAFGACTYKFNHYNNAVQRVIFKDIESDTISHRMRYGAEATASRRVSSTYMTQISHDLELNGYTVFSNNFYAKQYLENDIPIPSMSQIVIVQGSITDFTVSRDNGMNDLDALLVDFSTDERFLQVTRNDGQPIGEAVSFTWFGKYASNGREVLTADFYRSLMIAFNEALADDGEGYADAILGSIQLRRIDAEGQNTALGLGVDLDAGDSVIINQNPFTLSGPLSFSEDNLITLLVNEDLSVLDGATDLVLQVDAELSYTGLQPGEYAWEDESTLLFSTEALEGLAGPLEAGNTIYFRPYSDPGDPYKYYTTWETFSATGGNTLSRSAAPGSGYIISPYVGLSPFLSDGTVAAPWLLQVMLQQLVGNGNEEAVWADRLSFTLYNSGTYPSGYQSFTSDWTLTYPDGDIAAGSDFPIAGLNLHNVPGYDSPMFQAVNETGISWDDYGLTNAQGTLSYDAIATYTLGDLNPVDFEALEIATVEDITTGDFPYKRVTFTAPSSYAVNPGRSLNPDDKATVLAFDPAVLPPTTELVSPSQLFFSEQSATTNQSLSQSLLGLNVRDGREVLTINGEPYLISSFDSDGTVSIINTTTSLADLEVAAAANDPVQVEFVHANQPHGYYAEDGTPLCSLDLRLMWNKAIKDAPVYQYWAGEYETSGEKKYIDDPYGRKVLNFERASTGERFVIPVNPEDAAQAYLVDARSAGRTRSVNNWDVEALSSSHFTYYNSIEDPRWFWAPKYYTYADDSLFQAFLQAFGRQTPASGNAYFDDYEKVTGCNYITNTIDNWHPLNPKPHENGPSVWNSGDEILCLDLERPSTSVRSGIPNLNSFTSADSIGSFLESGVAPGFLNPRYVGQRYIIENDPNLEAGFRLPRFLDIKNTFDSGLGDKETVSWLDGFSTPRYYSHKRMIRDYTFEDGVNANMLFGMHNGGKAPTDMDPIFYNVQYSYESMHLETTDPLQPPVYNPDYVVSMKYLHQDRTEPFRDYVHMSDVEWDFLDYSEYPNQGGEGCSGGGGGGGGAERPAIGLLYPRGDRC